MAACIVQSGFFEIYMFHNDISSVNASVLKRMLTKSLSSKAFRTAKPFILDLSEKYIVEMALNLGKRQRQRHRQAVILVSMRLFSILSCFLIYLLPQIRYNVVTTGTFGVDLPEGNGRTVSCGYWLIEGCSFFGEKLVYAYDAAFLRKA
ncbi:hypothetical protein [Paenibacillus contaminans]|uniref:Uncharacterized protein n=1 Tax=Paenibacillus contaminans TaxID=450362 RepID=A0A329MM17_9BACL|nr:hypothetical protein [Paenibacillus contaminans]RAV18947.1 hypothetical protein DQG23_22610 [Paenibacillus contaminans]